MTSPNTDPPFNRLQIISHAHSPPLHPPPDFKYDLCKVTNPPKNIRDRYTGLDKRLQECFDHDEAFQLLLLQAEMSVAGHVEYLSARARARQVQAEGSMEAADGINREEDPFADQNEVCERADDPTSTQPTAHTIRVSCFCAMGRHRSVAFAEQLGRLKLPEGWIMEVEHRDLGKSRAERSTKSGRDQASRGKRNNFPELGE